ncbi:MAG: hypothetical protein AAB336_07125 [Acidobacteriota bacterium]
MSKNKFTKLKFENDHLSEDQLLMLVDGELSAKEASNTRQHLEICWTCRRELEKIEETISTFIEFRKKIQTPLNPAPPNKWNNFNRLLRETQRELEQPKRSWLNLYNFSPFQLRLGIASIAVFLITVLLFQLVTVEKISAAELLDKASIKQNEKVNSTSQPVVYQKLRVRAGDAKQMDWEVWNDAGNSRSKQTISGNQPKESIDVLQELSEILQKNRMDPLKPLSPESFKSWHGSLTDKTDEITENEAVTLKTTNHKISFDGQISEAVVRFRQNDFHPFDQIIKVKTANGEKTFQISEVNFEVVSLNTLKPNFFDETPISNEIVKITKITPSPSPLSSASPEATTSPGKEEFSATSLTLRTENNNPKPELTTKTIATADLEVEVLQLLSNAKADLGDEITVKRENGVLYVRGLVETPERKNEILNSLQSVRQNQAVKIELNTVAEAVAKQKSPPSGKPTKVDDLETKTLTSAAQNDLVEHFGNEVEARRFASNTVNRSSQALSHVYALRRLAKQFSAAELKNLSPEAKAKWLNLISSHARNFAANSESLSRELGNVFNAPRVSGAVNVEVNSLDDLPRAIESLFAMASSNDRLIRSALTLSDDDGKFSVLKAPQFWQSLKNAESLANKIAALK